jgi:hypothetical protein
VSDSQGEPEVWWFNTKTGDVEFGRKTNSVDRIGPFEDEADARNALDIVRSRAAAWRTQEETED